MTELHTAYVYALAHLANLGDRSALKLKRLFATYDDWLAKAPSDRRAKIEEAIGARYATRVATNWDDLIEQALKELRRHQSENISVLTIDDACYPRLLRTIPDPPLVLFVRGSVDSLTQSMNLAVVGTRDSTPRGEEVAARIARFFGTRGFSIVSGLAKGIDTAAHRGALDADARTVAVFGTPLNKIYPAENKTLAEEILRANGSWVSEIPLLRRPNRNSFVQRDRIQSGISIAVIPVQTDVQGGTMHTVEFAERQNRLIFCPRPLNGQQHNKQYAGIAALIDSKRAIPFQSEDYATVLDRLRAHSDILERSAKGKPSQPPTPTRPGRPPVPSRNRQPSASPQETAVQDKVIQQLMETFDSLGLSDNQETFDAAIGIIRKKLYGPRRSTPKPGLKPVEDSNVQIFKARLSKPIDQTVFTQKWRERSGGIEVRFRIKGTDLTAIHTRTLWDPSSSPGSEGFFNVLQMALHDVARDCTVVDCEEVTNVNA